MVYPYDSTRCYSLVKDMIDTILIQDKSINPDNLCAVKDNLYTVHTLNILKKGWHIGLLSIMLCPAKHKDETISFQLLIIAPYNTYSVEILAAKDPEHLQEVFKASESYAVLKELLE